MEGTHLQEERGSEFSLCFDCNGTGWVTVEPTEGLAMEMLHILGMNWITVAYGTEGVAIAASKMRLITQANILNDALWQAVAQAVKETYGNTP